MHQRLTHKSAMAKQAWTEDHPIYWDDTKILQHASHTMELVVRKQPAYRRHQRACTSIAMVAMAYMTAGSPRTRSSGAEPVGAAPTQPHHRFDT